MPASDCTAEGNMIQLRIQKESDLYNPYDPSQTKINEKVYHYLKSFCTELEYKKHLHDTLQLITDEPINEEKFKAALQEAVKQDRDEFDLQIAINRKRAIWGYIMGILLSIVGVTLSVFLDQILLALISFLGTMTISDAVTIQAKLNPDIKRLRRLLDPFSDFKLEVVQTDQRQSEG